MLKEYPSEQWKNVKFDFEYSNKLRMDVSNFGRLRTFNKIHNGKIIKGSTVNGYGIIRLKFFKARDEKCQKEMNELKNQINLLSKELKSLTDITSAEIALNQLTDLKKKFARKLKADEKKRVVYYQALIHRLVAQYFLPMPAASQTVVAHLDFNKLNNRSYNLKWMTPEENYEHQKKSPYVIEEKNNRSRMEKGSNTTKLSVTKVMLLKKLLIQNKPIRQLAKQFRITDTQIIRIKKGENWADIDAAK
jgi:hypothetical protein